MTAYRVTLEFNLTITDEATFSQQVHDFVMAQEGESSGLGATNKQQSADLIAQDHRMGISMWAVYALGLGVESLPGASYVAPPDIKVKNVPLD